MTLRFITHLERNFGDIVGAHSFPGNLNVVVFRGSSLLTHDVHQTMMSRSHWDPISAAIVHSREPHRALQNLMHLGVATFAGRRLVAVGAALNKFPNRPKVLGIPKTEWWKHAPVIWWARPGADFLGDDVPRPSEGFQFKVLLANLPTGRGRRNPDRVHFLVTAEPRFDGKGYKPVQQVFGFAVHAPVVIHYHRPTMLCWMHPPVAQEDFPVLEPV